MCKLKNTIINCSKEEHYGNFNSNSNYKLCKNHLELYKIWSSVGGSMILLKYMLDKTEEEKLMFFKHSVKNISYEEYLSKDCNLEDIVNKSIIKRFLRRTNNEVLFRNC